MSNSTPSASKTQFIEILFLWFAGISAAMQFAKFSVSYDALLQHYQAGETLTGAALSLVGVVGLMFGAFAGLIASRIGYLRVIMGALLIGGFMSFIQSSLPSFSILLVTRILEGFSQLGVVVAAPTLIAKLSAPKHRSLTMGLWGTFFGVAFAITGWLGKQILEEQGLQSLLLHHGVLISSMAIILFFLLRKNAVLDVPPLPTSQDSFLRQLIQVYRNPRSLIPSLVFLCYTCTLVSLITYVPRLVSDEKVQTLMMVSLPLLSTCGTFIAGALAQYVMKPQKVALVSYSGVAISSVILLIFAQQAIWFFALSGVLVLFLGMVPGAALAMIPTLARNQNEQAQGYGLIAQFGNLGATIGPPTFAFLISLYGLSGLVAMVLFICVSGSCFAFLASRIPTQKTHS